MITDILVDDEVNTENKLNYRASVFDESHTLHELKHYLPAQASLKDFIHHNTLHAFQKQKFHDGIRSASAILGYRVSFSLSEFRERYAKGEIRKDIVEQIIKEKKGALETRVWMYNLLQKEYEAAPLPRIGALRSNWKKVFRIDLDSMVHPILFRVLCAYLDQGIAMWNFPVWQKEFFEAIKEMERVSFASLFRTELPRKLLLETNCEITDLLTLVVGDKSLFEHYLFDQQFAHQGWSGMVATVEAQPETLLDGRQISLKDLIRFELLLEIDALNYQLGSKLKTLGQSIIERPTSLFAPLPKSELNEVLTLWQEAFEWTYYDEVLAGVKATDTFSPGGRTIKSFQGIFCIDDRECSFRRHLERIDSTCETFSTPGFFGVEFYFQPLDGKFYTKVCPAPVTPKFLIKEVGKSEKRKTDLHFTKQTHSLFRGWLISQTLGFWAAFKLLWNIFRPTMSPATATSFKHMDKNASLTIEHKEGEKENGLQIGFTVAEMALRMENMLKSIGLVKDFAELVYIVGHGSSSVNNPHYAAYDCGACSGRPGSVNSRVACYMANHPDVRKLLAARGIVIPNETRFVGGLHDTTRDEVVFYDEDSLSGALANKHRSNAFVFAEALNKNSKERSRRLVSINSHHTDQEIHEEVKVRSVSLFEPRPELNHATNALCIVGRRQLTKNLFLDRRAFMNSYDYRIDPDGQFLLNILKPAAPVCGGINLEYFFSRTDNQKLGAGTKLPHNVMGLIGVANGIDGDLRPGLPSQMIEVHDPVRLLVIVEHHPDVVLNTIKRSPETYEWFINDWVKLAVVEPETHHIYVFNEGEFTSYEPAWKNLKTVNDLTSLFEESEDNLPVLIIK
jgi:uncharacterized protein YbcC (UPF0753/DUF2309 family)